MTSGSNFSIYFNNVLKTTTLELPKETKDETNFRFKQLRIHWRKAILLFTKISAATQKLSSVLFRKASQKWYLQFTSLFFALSCLLIRALRNVSIWRSFPQRFRSISKPFLFVFGECECSHRLQIVAPTWIVLCSTSDLFSHAQSVDNCYCGYCRRLNKTCIETMRKPIGAFLFQPLVLHHGVQLVWRHSI